MIAYILPLLASVLFVINDVEGVPMDQAIKEAVDEGLPFNSDGNSNLVKTELDMIVTKDQLNSMSQSVRNKRTAGIKIGNRWGIKRWTNNIVYYEFAYPFTFREKNLIRGAIAAWEDYTCLKFKESSSAYNRIQFKNGGGCSSRLGMVGGPQSISLAKGCRTNRIIIHEIGHALGLFHEQSRPDRDQYVTVNKKNILSKVLYNFGKQTWNDVLNMGVNYDYRSIMHYGKRYFSKNGRDTITTKDSFYQNIIGNAYGLSFADVKTMNIMYNCKRHISSCTKNDNDCGGNGFVGKDCQCWCPADLNNRINFKSAKRCSDTGVGPGPGPKPVTPRPACKDMDPSCTHLAELGNCGINAHTRDVFCPKTCKTCSDTGVTPRPGPKPTSCKDMDASCTHLAELGNCQINEHTRNVFCPKTCKSC